MNGQEISCMFMNLSVDCTFSLWLVLWPCDWAVGYALPLEGLYAQFNYLLLSSWNSSVLNKWPGFSFCVRNCKWCSLFPSIVRRWVKTCESPFWASPVHRDFCLLHYFLGLSCQLHVPWGTQRSYLGLLAPTVMTLFYSYFVTYPWISLVWKDSSFSLWLTSSFCHLATSSVSCLT